MGIEFKPRNTLEQAVADRNCRNMIYALAEGHRLTTLAPASHLEYDCFPDEIVMAVLLIGANAKQLKTMTNGWFWGHLKAGARLRRLVQDVLEPLPAELTPLEKELIHAIVFRDHEELIRLIREKNARFYGFSPELLIMLPELSKAAVLTLLRDGLSAKLKALVFRIFLKEAEQADLLESFSYNRRLQYANLMMKLLAGDAVSAEDPWYPEDADDAAEKMV